MVWGYIVRFIEHAQREFDRLIKVSEHEKIPLPTKRQLEKKKAQMGHLTSQTMTEVAPSSWLRNQMLIDLFPRASLLLCWLERMSFSPNASTGSKLSRKDPGSTKSDP